MIPVSEALDHLFALVAPLGAEAVQLRAAAGRVLAAGQRAMRDQPPFAASAMDGYAVRAADLATGATLQVIGEAAAGRRFSGSVGKGQAVRIFTGAPLPDGADHVLIQEDAERNASTITIRDNRDSAAYVRPAGSDFPAGFLLDAPRVLGPADIALLAAMNIATVPVIRRPVVAVIATGDELVPPGAAPGPDQITASNSYGLAAMLTGLGAEVRLLPIARDTAPALEQALALAAGSDLILTSGGASVGDHDLVGQVTQSLGMERSFYKIAMRPGKPLLAGRLGKAALIGLPGNPVSALVCGTVFVAPVVRALLGLGAAPAPRESARLAAALPANGPREHYMRALQSGDRVSAFARQDSALLSVMAAANCLLVRPPHDPALAEGATVQVIRLR
jgi:molybdopterin molybdotransferase